MALRDLIDYLASSAPATALRGVGEGVSMGLTRYPAAGISYLASKAAGYDPQFKDVLSSIRQQERQLQQEQPIAYTGGNVLGSLIPLPTKPAGALATIARGAGQGAVAGFTQNEGMENVGRDVALGTLLGGTAGTVAAAIPKAQEAIVRTAAKRELSGSKAAAMAERDEAYNVLQNVPTIQRAKTTEDFNRRVEAIGQGKLDQPGHVQGAALQYEAAEDFIKNIENVQQKLPGLKGQDLLNTAQWMTTMQRQRDVKNLTDIFGNPLVGAGAGAALGAGAGILLDKDPLTLAALGGGGLALYDLKRRGLTAAGSAAAEQLAKVPYARAQQAADYVSGRALRATAPLIKEPEQRPSPIPEVKPWEMNWEAPASGRSAAPQAPSESPSPQPRKSSEQSQQQKPWEMDWGNK